MRHQGSQEVLKARVGADLEIFLQVKVLVDVTQPLRGLFNKAGPQKETGGASGKRGHASQRTKSNTKPTHLFGNARSSSDGATPRLNMVFSEISVCDMGLLLDPGTEQPDCEPRHPQGLRQQARGQRKGAALEHTHRHRQARITRCSRRPAVTCAHKHIAQLEHVLP